MLCQGIIKQFVDIVNTTGWLLLEQNYLNLSIRYRTDVPSTVTLTISTPLTEMSNRNNSLGVEAAGA